jgi:hypothetical protein
MVGGAAAANRGIQGGAAKATADQDRHLAPCLHTQLSPNPVQQRSVLTPAGSAANRCGSGNSLGLRARQGRHKSQGDDVRNFVLSLLFNKLTEKRPHPRARQRRKNIPLAAYGRYLADKKKACYLLNSKLSFTSIGGPSQT